MEVFTRAKLGAEINFGTEAFSMTAWVKTVPQFLQGYVRKYLHTFWFLPAVTGQTARSWLYGTYLHSVQIIRKRPVSGSALSCKIRWNRVFSDLNQVPHAENIFTACWEDTCDISTQMQRKMIWRIHGHIGVGWHLHRSFGPSLHYGGYVFV